MYYPEEILQTRARRVQLFSFYCLRTLRFYGGLLLVHTMFTFPIWLYVLLVLYLFMINIIEIQLNIIHLIWVLFETQVHDLNYRERCTWATYTVVIHTMHTLYVLRWGKISCTFPKYTYCRYVVSNTQQSNVNFWLLRWLPGVLVSCLRARTLLSNIYLVM